MKKKINVIMHKKLPSDIIDNNNLLGENYRELKELSTSLKKDKIEFLFFNRKKIHDILYKANDFINIDRVDGLSGYFYLILLINEEEDLIDYTFNFDLIKQLFDKNKNNQKRTKFEIAITSRIINKLINYFKNIDNTKSDISDEEIEKIKEENEKILIENINGFEEFDLNLDKNIMNLNLEQIYLEIIISLFKKRKFENYEYSLNIIKALDLEDIEITKDIYNKLSEILNSKDPYINDYILLNIEDLSNEKKINFNYILMKYIIKNSFYIYNIPFLLRTRKNILKIIKKKTIELLDLDFDNNDLNERRDYLLKTMTDSEYYNKYFIFKNKDLYKDLIVVLKYYEKILFESKKDQIEAIKRYINKGIKNKEIEEEYLKDLEKAKYYNDRYKIVNYVYNINGEKESVIKENYKKWKTLEKSLKEKKIVKIQKNTMKNIYNYFNDENKESIIKIFNEDIYDFITRIKLNKENFEKLREILKYYKNYFPESKKDNITEIEEILKKKDCDNFQKYLDEYDSAIKMNKRVSIINHILNYENKDMPKSENAINKATKSFENIENLINEGKAEEIPKDYTMVLINYFKDENNKNTLLQIFSQENIDNFIRIADIKKQSNINDNKQNNNYQNDKDIQNNNINGTSYNNNSIILNDNKLNKQNNSDFQIVNDATKSTASASKNTNIEEKAKIPLDETTKDYYKTIKRLFEGAKFFINFNKGKEPFEIIFLDNGTNLAYITFEGIGKHFKEKKIVKTDKNDILTNVENFYLLNDFLNEAKNTLEEEIINKDNLKIAMKFEKNNNDNTSERNKIIFNISVTYVFCLPNSNKQTLRFKDDNILINMTTSCSQALYYLIQEINDKKYINISENSTKDVSRKSSLSIDENKIENKINDDNNEDDPTKIIKINKKNVNIKADKMKIIEFRKIIGKHQEKKRICSAIFIMELSNGYFISGGTDNVLMIYDSNGEILPGDMGTINKIKDWTYSISERVNYDKRSKDLVQFICCSNKELYLMDGNFKEKQIKVQKYELPNSTCIKCVEMNQKSFALLGLDLSSFFPDLFKNDTNETQKVDSYTIIDKTYRNAIKINDNILALVSNKVAINGEDALIFFDHTIKTRKKQQRIVHKIENYSFNLNTTGLSLMYCDKENKNKILLCACKKYFNDQKNGILLVNPQLNDNHEVNDPFYDTGDFEVYCFCPIFDFNYENKVYEKEEIIKSTNTEFFLVGGFDNNSGNGLIKLYKLIFNEKAYKVKAEYLQDIVIKKEIIKGNEDESFDFEGFGGAITSLIQSKKSGIILASCNDGNIYKMSVPNIDFYKR